MDINNSNSPSRRIPRQRSARSLRNRLRRFHFKLPVGLVAAAVCLGNEGRCTPLWAQGRTDNVAHTGQGVPGGDGTFNFLGQIQINASGQMAFGSTLSGTSGGSTDNSGFFFSDGATATTALREGMSIPIGPGTLAEQFPTFLFNNLGQLVVGSNLSGTSGGTANDTGVFRSQAGSLTQLAREGQSAFGNGTLGGLAGTSMHLNQGGSLVFNALAINGTVGGTTDNEGLFAVAPTGVLSQIVRKGQAVPEGGGTFSSFVSFSNNGPGVAFIASLAGTPDNSGLFRNVGGTISQIARTSQAAPDGNGLYSQLQFMRENQQGEIVATVLFSGTVGGAADNSGLVRFQNGTAVVSARRGNAVPGGDGVFGTFNSASIGNGGHVVFESIMNGTSAGTNNDFGIFREKGGLITTIAREGQTVPGGVGVFLEPSVVSSPFALGNVNQAGDIVFVGKIGNTGIGSGSGSGVYVGDGIDLIEVARDGQATPVGTAISFSVSGQSINDMGQVVYRASTATGSTAFRRWTPDLHWRSSASGNWDDSTQWTLGLNPAAVHDVAIDSAASLVVNGPTQPSAVRSLQVGGSTGVATLNLQAGASLIAQNGVVVANKGILTGDGVIVGTLTNQMGGQVVADNLTVTGTLTNHGVIRGSGLITSGFVNSSGGQIRANNGDNLRFAGGPSTNQGRIEVILGQLEVANSLTNAAGTGFITGRNALMRFDGGLNNQGAIGLSLGTSDVLGDINNAATGQIQISGGSHVTFYDDVIQNGTMVIADVGGLTSNAVVFGSFSGSGGFTGGGNLFAFGDLRPGNSPGSVLFDGSLFLGSGTQTLIELGGIAVGQFDQLRVTGDLGLAGNLSVSLIGGHQLSAGQTYLIGDILGQRTGQFTGLGEGAWLGNFAGQDLFLTYQAGDGNDLGFFTAVPEVGSVWGLVSLGLAGLAYSRRRRGDR